MKLSDLLKKYFIYTETVDRVESIVRRSAENRNKYEGPEHNVVRQGSEKLRWNFINTEINDNAMRQFLDDNSNANSTMTIYQRKVRYILGKVKRDWTEIETQAYLGRLD